MITAIPGSVPLPPMLIRMIIAVMTVIAAGIAPKTSPVTLIRIDRVSKTIPACITKGNLMIATQMSEMRSPQIITFNRWLLRKS
ncbi:hypothetical protein SDC9_192411 [bioreactor metagenome]|uniref:Uncharacterized protein n=1 Tax=bioreactor metagenome TaxID=1076179 RepID=A0A645I953_9ZZZZ